MDVVLEDAAVGGFQRQKVLVPGLDGFQPVLSVLGLALRWEKERERDEWKARGWRETKGAGGAKQKEWIEEARERERWRE